MDRGLNSPQEGQAGVTGSALTLLGSVEGLDINQGRGGFDMTGRINQDTVAHTLDTIPEGTLVLIVHLSVDVAIVELDGDTLQVEPEAVDGPTLHVIHEEVA